MVICDWSIDLNTNISFVRFWWKYLNVYKKLHKIDVPNCEQLLVLPLFMSNFIGIMFARSLHYQFYVWYYHTLHYLAWTTPFSTKFKLTLLGRTTKIIMISFQIIFSGIIEMCWNTYPSTVASSVSLHLCHVTIFVGLILHVSKSCDMTMFTSVDKDYKKKLN